MIDDMDVFRTTIAIASLAAPNERRTLHDVMVGTETAYNWVAAELLVPAGPVIVASGARYA